jgi:hypothetical protein
MRGDAPLTLPPYMISWCAQIHFSFTSPLIRNVRIVESNRIIVCASCVIGNASTLYLNWIGLKLALDVYYQKLLI